MLVTGALLVTSATALAGGLTLEERVQRLERQKEMAPAPARPVDTSGLSQRIDALEAALKKAPFGLKIGGMVVTSYLYDFNNPDSRLVSLRSFDRNDNTFSLDLFQLQVSREPGDDGVGFVTKVNFGKTAERMASDWDGDGSVGNVVEEQQLDRARGGVHHLQLPRPAGARLQGRQVRHPGRRRGDRVAAELQHQPLAGVQLGDSLHPHRRARDLQDRLRQRHPRAW